jgi:plasmid stabilization system protein ParE
MAELVWVEPALSDLDEIADFIALDDPEAAHRLVSRVLDHVERLAEFPELGARVPELRRSRCTAVILLFNHRRSGERTSTAAWKEANPA